MDIFITILLIAIVYWMITSAGISLWYLLVAIVLAVIVLALLRGRRGRGTF
jgi:hypothetical protein